MRGVNAYEMPPLDAIVRHVVGTVWQAFKRQYCDSAVVMGGRSAPICELTQRTHGSQPSHLDFRFLQELRMLVGFLSSLGRRLSQRMNVLAGPGESRGRQYSIRSVELRPNRWTAVFAHLVTCFFLAGVGEAPGESGLLAMMCAPREGGLVSVVTRDG